MKLDRLLSIIILLINRRKVQAKDLADQFEVSVRTIYRDIETINQAGIPVITYQGANGGIGLTEGYRLDRNLLTNNDLVAIASALRSVSTSHRNMNTVMLMEKINSIIPDNQKEEFQFRTNKLIVDFTSWGHHHELEHKVAQFNRAIDDLHLVTFTYSDAAGSLTERKVEPYTLVLKGQKWYLYAFCRSREQFRMFKLMRMKNITILDQIFLRRQISFNTLPWNQEEPNSQRDIKLVLRFNHSIKHLAEDTFDLEALVMDAAGRYTVTVSFPDNDWLYGFILSFGPNVEVMEPEHVRHRIKQLAAQTADNY
jgi:predicted DNA-binding transcriptional regulator YafY